MAGSVVTAPGPGQWHSYLGCHTVQWRWFCVVLNPGWFKKKKKKKTHKKNLQKLHCDKKMRQWNAIISLHFLLLPGIVVILRGLSPSFFPSFKYLFPLWTELCLRVTRLHWVGVVLPWFRPKLPGASASAEACPWQSPCELPLSSACCLYGIICAYRIHVETSPGVTSHLFPWEGMMRRSRSIGNVFQREEEVKYPSWRKPAENGCGWGKGLERGEREGLEGDGQCDLRGCPGCN